MGLEAGRAALVALLAAYRRARGHHRITVVFDGGSRPAGSGGARVAGIDVRFSPPGQSADAVIARLAREGRTGVLVVSSDREVARAAAACGAATASCEEFAARLETAALANLKGGDPDDRDEPRTDKKGTARRLPKAERRRAAALRRL